MVHCWVHIQLFEFAHIIDLWLTHFLPYWVDIDYGWSLAGSPSPNSRNFCEEDQTDVDDLAADPSNIQITDVMAEEGEDACAPNTEHDYAHPDPVLEFIPQKIKANLLKNSQYNHAACPAADKVSFIL